MNDTIFGAYPHEIQNINGKNAYSGKSDEDT